MSNLSVHIDGRELSVPAGQTLNDFFKDHEDLRNHDAVAAYLDGEVIDFHTALPHGGTIRLIMADSPEALPIIRHSTAHVMAEAVQRLFPGTKVTIGPPIENGFYYDFDSEHVFTPEDLRAIEKEMKNIIKRNDIFERSMVSSEEAKRIFREKNEDYKVELIEDLGVDEVSFYTQGEWFDLCRGPHVPRAKRIKAFKLMSVAGAYWRGDENRKMLQRIYGTAFATKEELDEYLNFLEEAKKRDHRVLGKQLELFMFNDEAGAGFPIFLPRGMRLRTVLEEWEKKEHYKRGYEIVSGPTLLKQDLWVRSGHWDHYRENMYFTQIDETGYGVKPMNCLSHMLIFKSKTRSFRDLPQRYFELGLVHRHEMSGVLNGLLRVRAFTQDDAHIICMPEQLPGEIKGVIRFVQDVMNIFGFDYKLEISTRPEKAIGDDEIWEQATNALKSALDDLDLPYEINEGDGAFYGPKIDVKLMDCLKREWQCATVQCDFALPERFELEYVGSDNATHRPVMIHRVILGSVERFLGVLTEHFAGAFPLWISPVQAVVMTISEKSVDYGHKVAETMQAAGFRVEADLRDEKIGKKIAEWREQKVPYMLVVGEKEAQENRVAPRTRSGETLEPMSLSDFMQRMQSEVDSKAL
ncbi:MAG: threonine--tRNA ligase [Deltaproteobacteria bacterium]|nr:threonine--tRNA ligase [Deltaproteobacteria bacterium]MCB9488517.1 threonine--tRNA ligase [Deltaproteobacteria bacterium]